MTQQTILSAVRQQELEDYIKVLEQREETLVQKWCGERYSREEKEYWRCKTKKKSILTRFGKINRTWVYIKKEGGVCFSPLLRELEIEEHQHLSLDLKQTLSDKASKMPYRRAVEDILNSFSFSISPTTLHAYVRQTAPAIQLTEKPDQNHKIIMADGTKIRGKKKKHEAMVILSLGEESSSEKNLLAFGMNQNWKEMAENTDLTRHKVFVGDGEQGLADAFLNKGLRFHYCHVHAPRELGFYLWKDGQKKEQSKIYVDRLKSVFFCLQRSTEKHRQDKDWARLLQRISWSKEHIRILIADLKDQEYAQAAGFLERNINFFTTAAEMALEGIRVPWTTNTVEKVMQEVGWRTKKKGMYWSEKGATNILNITLKRYFLSQKQRNYKQVFTIQNQQAEIQMLT